MTKTNRENSILQEWIGSIIMAALESPFPKIRNAANRSIINVLAYAVEPRPRPITMAAPYTTWRGLTDRTISGRQLPEASQEYMDSLPPIEDVLNLFKREKETLDDQTSLLFPMFAQWFTDSFLRTKWKPPPNDFKNNESNMEIDLNQIYGMAEIHTNMLRSLKGGKLKSQIISGDEYPVFLFEKLSTGEISVKPEFDGLYTPTNFERVFENASDEHKLNCFAVGLEHGNSTMGNSCMNILFLREHNRIASILGETYNEWDDERIFQTTRNIMIVMLIRIVISDYVCHIAGDIPLFVDTEDFFPEQERWYRTNWMSVEFNLLYRWHDLIPDTLTLKGETMPSVKLRQNNKAILELGLDQVLLDASNQKAGHMGLQNTPDFLLPVRAMSLNMTRTCKLQPFVKYCEEYGLEPPKTFDELTGGDAALSSRLRELYGTIDKLEWFVGLFAQHRYGKFSTTDFAGALMLRMVGNDAVTQALTNPLLSKRVYNAQTFSPKGLTIIESTSRLSQIILRNTNKIKCEDEVGFGMDRQSDFGCGGSFFSEF